MTTNETAPQRFYYKWSAFYESYAVYDRSRKNPEGNDYLVIMSEDIDFLNWQDLVGSLNNGNKELFERYGIE